MESGRGKLDFDCGSCKVEGPNFSLINYEDAALCDILSDVDVCDWNLWLSAAAIILQPQLCLLIDYKYKRNTWSTQLGPLTFFLGLFKLWHFLETVHEQPTWSTLQNDWGMYAGQSLLTIGAFLLLICLARFGAWDTFVRIDFRTTPPGSPQKKSTRRQQLSHVPRKYRDLAVNIGFSLWCVILLSVPGAWCQSLSDSQKTVVLAIVGLVAGSITVLTVVLVICCCLDKHKQNRMFKNKQDARRIGPSTRRGQVGPGGEEDEGDSEDEEDGTMQNQQMWSHQGQYHSYPDPAMWMAHNIDMDSMETLGTENAPVWSRPPSYRSTESPPQAPLSQRSRGRKRQGAVLAESGPPTQPLHPNSEEAYGLQMHQRQQQLAVMLHNGQITQQQYQQQVMKLQQSTQHIQQQYQQQLATMLQNGQITEEQYQQQVESLQQTGHQASQQVQQEYLQKIENMLQGGQITQEQHEQYLADMLRNGQLSEQQHRLLLANRQRSSQQSSQQTRQQYLRKLANMLQCGQISSQQYQQYLVNMLHNGQITQQKYKQLVKSMEQSGHQASELVQEEYQQKLAAMLRSGQMSQQQYQQVLSNMQQQSQHIQQQPPSQEQQEEAEEEEEEENTLTTQEWKQQQQQREQQQQQREQQQQQQREQQKKEEQQQQREQRQQREEQQKQEKQQQLKQKQEQAQRHQEMQQQLLQQEQEGEEQQQEKECQQQFKEELDHQQQLKQPEHGKQQQEQGNQEQEQERVQAEEPQRELQAQPEAGSKPMVTKRKKKRQPRTPVPDDGLAQPCGTGVQSPDVNMLSMQSTSCSMYEPSLYGGSMGMEISQHENMDQQDPGMGMGSAELAGMPTGEEAYTEGHDPQVTALGGQGSVQAAAPQAPAYFRAPTFYAGGMYGEQPPSYPGVDAMMVGGSMGMVAGDVAGGTGTVTADSEKKKKKKKTLKKKGDNLAQTIQDGSLEWDPLPPSAPPVSMEMTDGSSGIVVSSFGKINAAVDDDMDGDTEF